MSGREPTAALNGAASSLTAKQTRVRGEGGIPVKGFVTGDVTLFVTALLRVRPQFRSHFTDVLRVLRLQRGEGG